MGVHYDRKVLSDDQQKFLDWILDPSASKGTLREFAVSVGKSYDTVKKWKSEPLFRAEWERRAQRDLGSPENIATVLKALLAEAQNGNQAAAKTYLDYMGKIRPPKPPEDRDVASLSDQELVDALRSAADRLEFGDVDDPLAALPGAPN
jgi:hypothetical protein